MAKRFKHKFGAIRDERDGIKFPSRLEARYYDKLKLAQRSGELLFFLRQPLFDLGGGVPYRADFMEFWAPKEGEECGEIRIVDVKGMPPTEAFKVKKRIVESKYPIEIEIVRKV